MRNRSKVKLSNVEKRLGDRYETCERYAIGYSTLIVWAREIGAVVKFGKATRFDWTKLDASVDEKFGKKKGEAE